MQNACIESFAKNEPTFFYVVYCEKTGLYKIGQTNDFLARVKSLSSISALLMTPIFWCVSEPEIDIPSREVERLCHKFFKSQRVSGEWFRLSTRDLVKLRNLVHSDLFSGGLYDYWHDFQ